MSWRLFATLQLVTWGNLCCFNYPGTYVSDITCVQAANQLWAEVSPFQSLSHEHRKMELVLTLNWRHSALYWGLKPLREKRPRINGMKLSRCVQLNAGCHCSFVPLYLTIELSSLIYSHCEYTIVFFIIVFFLFFYVRQWNSLGWLECTFFVFMFMLTTFSRILPSLNLGGILPFAKKSKNLFSAQTSSENLRNTRKNMTTTM